ncbi:MAG: hypothetical protein AAGF12_36030 [Myxococcota bacterium]
MHTSRVTTCLFFSLIVACSDDVSGGADAASAAEGGTDAAVSPSERFLVGGITITPDGRVGYGVVVDGLRSDVEVDLTQAATFPGQPAIAASPALDGTAWVGLDEEPVVQRYRLGDSDQLEFEAEFSAAPLGLTSASGGLAVVSPEKGYLFDLDSLSIVQFHPTEMLLGNSLPIEGVETEPGETNNFSFLVRDGDRIIVVVNFFRADGTAIPRSRAVFLDTRTDTLSYADIEGCGRLGWSAKDADGNIFFATHPAQAGLTAGGLAGAPPSPACMATIPAGEASFRDGFLDLETLASAPAGALAQGVDGAGYTLVFDDPTIEVSQDNGDQLSLLPGWSYYSFRFGDEEATLTRVPGLDRGLGIAIDFQVREGDGPEETPFIVQIGLGFGRSTAYDMTDPAAPVARLDFPGIPFGAIRLR